MSHDLRSPLGAILNFGAILSEDKVRPAYVPPAHLPPAGGTLTVEATR